MKEMLGWSFVLYFLPERELINLFDSSVMYNHRTTDTRFDCVDLDPYGSAVPFLDAAIGAVADGGESLYYMRGIGC